MEARLSYNEHATKLYERKLDDFEQVSRKVNLRIRGIKVEKNDSPANIMSTIKDQAEALNLEIPAFEYDRCHRIGHKYDYKGVTHQDVLLKLSFWRTRDLLYRYRKSFTFKISPDLTQRRSALLEFARDQVEIDAVTKRSVEFVFCDKNCKFAVFSKSKRFYSFSSWLEFLNIVDRLDGELTNSKEFLADEENGLPDREAPSDLYY